MLLLIIYLWIKTINITTAQTNFFGEPLFALAGVSSNISTPEALSPEKMAEKEARKAPVKRSSKSTIQAETQEEVEETETTDTPVKETEEEEKKPPSKKTEKTRAKKKEGEQQKTSQSAPGKVWTNIPQGESRKVWRSTPQSEPRKVWKNTLVRAAVKDPRKIRLAIARQILATGEKFLGTPYQFGSPAGYTQTFDCSSFIQYIYGENGILLPRTSRQQAEVGTLISPSNFEIGDLLFFQTPTSNGEIRHVVMYIKNNWVLHVWNGPEGVHFQNLSHPLLSDKFMLARRIIE